MKESQYMQMQTLSSTYSHETNVVIRDINQASQTTIKTILEHSPEFGL
jgi:hypothetical protein